MSGSIIKGLKCSDCGGSIDIEEGDRVLKCPYCSSSLYVKGNTGLERFWSPYKITADDAGEAVKKWFHGLDKAKDLRDKAEIKDISPVFIPFFRFRMDLAGWVLGRERKGDDDYRDVEKIVLKPYDVSTAAVNTAELGVRHVGTADAELLPFDRDEAGKHGMIFDPVYKAGEILSRPDEKVIDKVRGSFTAGLTELRFQKYFLLHKSAAAIYYPMWIVRYDYRGRSYQIVVDGRNSKILYGKAPGNNLYRAAVLILCLIIGNFFLTTFLQGGFRSSDSSNGSGGILMIIIPIAVMLFGYHKFRFGGEVTTGETKGGFKLPEGLGGISFGGGRDSEVFELDE